MPVPTNSVIDDCLIEKARKTGSNGRQKEAVDAALDADISCSNQMRILDLFGTVEYRESYDYKANRRRDRIENER